MQPFPVSPPSLGCGDLGLECDLELAFAIFVDSLRVSLLVTRGDWKL
jgi:hypothetical protein